MTQPNLVADIGDALVLAAFCAAVLFIVTYTAMAPWWRHQIGISLVVVDAGLALALGPSVLHHAVGLSLADQVWYGWYFCASLALVTCGVVWRTVVQVWENWDNPRMLRARGFVRGWLTYARWLLVRR